jgi:hypothetical protein
MYDKRHSDGLRLHDIYTKLHDDQFRNLRNIIVITTTTILEAVILVLPIEGIYGICL